MLWKTSCMVPEPTIPHPKDFNSYRPAALTSHLIKTLERLEGEVPQVQVCEGEVPQVQVCEGEVSLVQVCEGEVPQVQVCEGEVSLVLSAAVSINPALLPVAYITHFAFFNIFYIWSIFYKYLYLILFVNNNSLPDC